MTRKASRPLRIYTIPSLASPVFPSSAAAIVPILRSFRFWLIAFGAIIVKSFAPCFPGVCRYLEANGVVGSDSYLEVSEMNPVAEFVLGAFGLALLVGMIWGFREAGERHTYGEGGSLAPFMIGVVCLVIFTAFAMVAG